MLNGGLLERVLLWASRQHGESALVAARRAFEERTGLILEGSVDYEARIGHFWEQWLSAGARSAFSRFANAQSELSDADRRELAGWLRSHRSLYRFEEFEAGCGRVYDLARGGTFRFAPSERDTGLTPGDLFDGRLVPLAGALYLSPGRVFHPAEAHDALEALLSRVDLALVEHEALLDALLLMRSRFLQFESVRAEHIYQASALSPVRLRLRAEPSRSP